MAKTTGVYGITVEGEDCIYIGASYNVEKRFDWHKYHMKKSEHPNKQLQNEYYVNGDKFVFFLIEEIYDEEELGLAEQVWKDYYLHETEYYVFNDNDTKKVRTRMSDDEKVRRSKSQRGSRNYNSKLSETDVREIKRLINLKVQHNTIAEHFDVSVSAIGNISAGIRWGHVS